MLSNAQLNAKITQYEHFVNDVLKVDLQKSNESKALIEQELQEYIDLETRVQLLQQESLKELKTKVDLGAEVLCQAHVPDTSRIFVSIGLGFHVECMLGEVSRAVAPRKQSLKHKIEECTAANAKIKANIKFVEEAIRELLGLPKE